MKTSKILRIGHRGAMGHVTENTIASVQKAVDMECDMIEIDVYKIKSGELMVFHDHTLNRLTNEKGNIEDYTFNELRKIKVNETYQIPTLQEIIETIDRKAVLNIELKGTNTTIESYNIIQQYFAKGWRTEHFVISSFHWNELEIMSQQENPVSIAVLTAKNLTEEAIPFALKINAVAINPYYKLIGTESIKAIRNTNLKVYPWTVNKSSDIERLKKLKVDGIITDFPELI